MTTRFIFEKILVIATLFIVSIVSYARLKITFMLCEIIEISDNNRKNPFQI